MIATLLASLIGFLSSAIPEILKYMHAKQDAKQELAKVQGMVQLQEVQAQANAAEMASLYDSYKTEVMTIKGTWVELYNAIVRPTISLGGFAMYVAAKIAKVVLAYHIVKDLPWTNVSLLDGDIIWGEFDQCVLAGIISFYFGGRAFEKLRK